MFKRKLDFQQTQFAIGEALAHVNHLVALGDLDRIIEPGQPLRYQSVHQLKIARIGQGADRESAIGFEVGQRP